MVVDLFLKYFELASRCTHKSQCKTCSGCTFGVLNKVLEPGCVLPVAFRVFALHDAECFAPELSAFLLFNSRTVRTSSSACRRSFSLTRDITLRLLAFLLVRSA